MAGINTEPVFVSDIDTGANEWLAANMPDVPNLGDFTALDELPDVDIITAGFPCQPVSTAGRRAGINDERWIFDDITRLTGRMGTRPLLFLENVPGLLTANGGDAMARVVHSMASIGYDITWGTLPAAAVGAPHRRNRWWGLAYPADASGIRWEPRPRLGTGEPAAIRRHGLGNDNRTAAADTDCKGSQRWPLHAERRNEQFARARSLGARFGRYADAVARWEIILGRAAPDPTDDGRLNPAFVEHMMGYPAGWACGTLTNRREALHALGNAVVPQCAAQAFTQLTQRNQQ
jgi:DNA (cytosine-5)-methyltransferase 1